MEDVKHSSRMVGEKEGDEVLKAGVKGSVEGLIDEGQEGPVPEAKQGSNRVEPVADGRLVLVGDAAKQGNEED